MRIADEIVVSTEMDGIIHDPEDIYMTIEPEEGMEDTFILPLPVAAKLAEDIQSEFMDRDFARKDINNEREYYEKN